MESARPASLIARVRQLGSHVLKLAQVRLELLVVEIEEERARLARLLVLGGCAFFFLGFGTLALALLLTVLWWDTQRLLPLAVLSAFFLGGALVCIVGCWRAHSAGSRLFAASLIELARDREALDGSSHSPRT